MGRSNQTKPTFYSWLKKQAGRGDCVGDLAFDTKCANQRHLQVWLRESGQSDKIIPFRSNNKNKWKIYLHAWAVSRVVYESLDMAFAEWENAQRGIEP